MEFGLSRKNSAGGIADGGGGYFIADPPFTFLLIVGENVARRTGATRLGLTPCNCPDARIFASRGAVARASGDARTSGTRIFLARAGVEHASLGRAQGICTR